MKIGLLTFHWVPNFGANLQSLATYSYLKSLGHEVIFLNYREPTSMEFHQSRVSEGQHDMHKKFCDYFLPQTRPCVCDDDLYKVSKELSLECIVVGSDALLRIRQDSGRNDLIYPNPFWGKWCHKVPIKSIGLSLSSMGTAFWQFSRDERKAMAADLRGFSRISVRDDWSKMQLSFLAKRRIIKTPDPVVLLKESHFLDYPIDNRCRDLINCKKYIVVCFRRGHAPINWLLKFKKLINNNGYNLVALAHPEGLDWSGADCNLDAPINPIDWFRVLTNSSGVIAERFHPIAISIYLGVPFVAVDNYQYNISGLKGFIKKRRSKTWDICNSARLSKYCIPADQFTEKITPNEALELIEDFDHKSADEFRNISEKNILSYIGSNIRG